MLLSRCIRRLRCSTVPGRPNNRSKTTRGLISMGTGVVADDHEIVFIYAQAYWVSQPPT